MARGHVEIDETPSDPMGRWVERRTGRWVLGVLSAALSAALIAGGAAYLKPGAPDTRADSEPLDAVVRGIRIDLDRHMSESRGTLTIWQEDRAQTARFRETSEARLAAIERKLDQVLDRLDRRQAARASDTTPTGAAVLASTQQR